MQEIQRSPRKPFTVTFAVDVADSGIMAMGLTSAFAIYLPATLAAPVTLSFYGAGDPSDLFLPIYLSDGSRAELTANGGRIVIAPPELFAVPLLKATSSVAFDATILSKG